MNTKIFFLLFSLSLVLLPTLVTGNEIRQIHVELSYSGTAASFILYQDGVQVCVNNIPNATQMDCTVEIGTAPMTFVLTAVDANGVESPQSAPYVVTPPPVDPITGNYIPQANFTVSTLAGVAPLLTSFDASASTDLDGVIVSYNWDFGDGGMDTGTLINHTFTTAGTYTVTLTVIDDGGASATKTTTITVSPPPPPLQTNQAPVAVFTAIPLQSGSSQIAFDGSNSSDADGTIASYSWNFGDGDSITGKSVTHDYVLAGSYTAVLTVTDNQGATSSDQILITIVDAPKPANTLPVAVISSSTQKRLLHFAWDYSGATPIGFRLYQNGRQVCEIADPAARQADCLSFVDNGTVRFWVTAYDQAGVESAPSGPLSFDSTGLVGTASGDAPLAVHFTSGASTDPDGTITAYAWDFGDGSVADGMAVDNIFTVPGSYTVTMTVTDNSGGQSQATVLITVTGGHPPQAVNASFSTLQDKSLTATLSASDADGSPLSFKIAQNGSLGTATITNATTGVFTYVPTAGASGSDTFTFKANDGTFDSNEAVVSIAIQKANSPPTATNQTLSVQEDGSTTGTLTASDADSDPLSYTLVSLPTHGTATLTNANTGAFTYTPAANYNGPDSFTFKANDGTLDSNIATVTVAIAAVNDPPTAAAINLSTTEDTPLAGQLSGADPDGDALTYSIINDGVKGTAVITNASTGTFTYTPAANLNGADSFVYQVSDGKLTTTATVTVMIAPVNDAPTAASSTLNATEDTVATGQLSGSDPDGDVLTFSIVANGTKGTAVITNANTGAFTYTPAANQSGQDSFSYQVSDGKLTITAAVAVTIAPANDAPTAADLPLDATEDTVATGQLSGSDPDGDVLTYAIVANGTKGTAIITDASTGAFTYTPATNQSGQDSFSYQVSDGALTAEATVSVSIAPVNHPPTAVNSSLAAVEDTIVKGQFSGSDPDGDALTYSIITNGSKGKAVITNASTGAFTYTPAANQNGQDSIIFRLSDGQLTSDATLTVMIAPVNDQPTAAADYSQVKRGESVSIPVLLNDSDPDGQPLQVVSVSAPRYGKATIVSGAIVYTANATFTGKVKFPYTMSDGAGGLATGIVTVMVVP